MLKECHKLGKELISLRGNQSQKEVAKELGITEESLNDYENGCRMPRDEVKIRISDFYKVSIVDLFIDESYTD